MNVWLTAAGLLVGLAVAELGLRVFAQSEATLSRTLRSWDPDRLLIEPHGTRGYRQRPSARYRYPNGTVATSNAMSYRGPEVTIPKPAGTFRIVLLGGSATHGYGVNDGEAIDDFMRLLLGEVYPDRRFEVVNLAFDGYDSYQVLARLRSDGLRLEPDLVVVNTGINDVRNARFRDLQPADPRTVLWMHVLTRLSEEQRRGGPTLWTRAKRNLYVARLPGVLRHLREESFASAAPGPAEPYPDAIDYFAANLRAVADAALHKGIPVLFSAAPSSLPLGAPLADAVRRSYLLATTEQTQEYRERLAARLRALVSELQVEGLSVGFVEHDLTLELFLDDAHLTAEGNRAMAEDFARAAEIFIDAGRPSVGNASEGTAAGASCCREHLGRGCLRPAIDMRKRSLLMLPSAGAHS